MPFFTYGHLSRPEVACEVPHGRTMCSRCFSRRPIQHQLIESIDASTGESTDAAKNGSRLTKQSTT